MSFVRIIYNILFPTKVSISLSMIRDFLTGTYIDTLEPYEFELFWGLAQKVNGKDDLMQNLKRMLDGEKGTEIKESLYQNREFVHSIFENENHVLQQISKLIRELETQTIVQERIRNDNAWQPQLSREL